MLFNDIRLDIKRILLEYSSFLCEQFEKSQTGEESHGDDDDDEIRCVNRP